jgi:hypothetical protein
MIDWELGAVDCWISFDGTKPFPLTFYRKNGTWCHTAYPETKLNDKQQLAVDAFVKERINDMQQMWKPNMYQRLPWVQPIGKRNKR